MSSETELSLGLGVGARTSISVSQKTENGLPNTCKIELYSPDLRQLVISIDGREVAICHQQATYVLVSADSIKGTAP